MKLSVTFLALGASIASAAPQTRHWTRDHQVFESSNSVRQGWKYHSKPHPDQVIDLRIALKENQAIFDHAMEISDPSHERYGQHVCDRRLSKRNLLNVLFA